MRVQDVMTKGVQTVSPAATAEAAWALMRQKGIHHLVVTRGREIAGILSDRDIGGRKGAALRRGQLVADLMTEPAVTAAPTMTVRQAANVMRGRTIGCLVVANGGRPVGIVTASDLLTLIGQGLDRQAATSKRWTERHRVPHRKTAVPSGVW